MKILFVTLLVVILDQVSKFYIKGLKIESLGINLQGMPYASSKPILGDFIRITFIENPGMAFGLDIGPKMFLTIFTIIASIVIFIYIYKHRNDNFLIRLSLALILGGALGNLIDRTFYGMIYNYGNLFYGRVVDFIQIDIWDFTIFGKTYSTWPIFNIADVSVTLGFLIIVFFHRKIFKSHEKEIIHGEKIPIQSEIDEQMSLKKNGEMSDLNSGLLNLDENPESPQQIRKSEDTKENSHSYPPGPEKNEN
ncbi:MAG: signal peptidase II [Ignavibacteria bacterium]